MSHTQDHIERAKLLIQEGRRITVCEVAEMLDIRQTTTYDSQRRSGLLPTTVLLQHDTVRLMLRPQQ
jgi:hypothetical protein